MRSPGWAALRWLGGRWFDGTAEGGRVELPVTIATPGADVRAQAGIRICKEPLATSDVVVHDGIRLTTAARSAVLAMRHATSVVEAVVSTEMAAYSDLVSIAEARSVLDDHPGTTGNPRARQALALAHENSWSPMETRLRLLWQLTAGLPAPLVNAPVFDLCGRHLGTLPTCWTSRPVWPSSTTVPSTTQARDAWATTCARTGCATPVCPT